MGSRQKVKEIVVILGPKCGGSFDGTERDDEESQGPWTTSQWDEVTMGLTQKNQRGRRVRQSGVQRTLTGVRISPDSQRMEEMIARLFL